MLQTLFLVFLLYTQQAQSNELGTSAAPTSSIRPRRSPPRTSPRPIAADRLYNEFHSDSFCSPPPTRSQCPSYSEVFKNSANGWDSAAASSPSGRPCFVRHDSIKNTQFPNYPYRSYSVYSTSNPNVFEADVPILFDYSRLTGPDKEKQYADFVKKAQACLDNGRPPISDGSKTLKVKIIALSANEIKTADEQLYTQTTWEANPVNLHPSFERADSGNYSVDSSCETISHEIMHLLGLHDEYHETQTTYTPNKYLLERELGINVPQSLYDAGVMDQTEFDCRQVSVSANLMNDHTAFSRDGFIVYNCNLDRDTGAFQTTVDLNPGSTCPATYDKELIGTFANLEAINQFQDMATEYVTELRTRRHNTMIYRPLNASDMPHSLRSGQISQILRPNCMSRPEIRTYLSASRNAYENRFTSENGGQCRR